VSHFDWTTLLSKAPRNCWIASNEEQTALVGSGKTMEEAVKQANTKGVHDPIVIWVPKNSVPLMY
jgi:hypothetical protein